VHRSGVQAVCDILLLNSELIGAGDGWGVEGEGQARHLLLPKKISGKYFSGKYHVKFGHFC